MGATYLWQEGKEKGVMVQKLSKVESEKIEGTYPGSFGLILETNCKLTMEELGA